MFHLFCFTNIKHSHHKIQILRFGPIKSTVEPIILFNCKHQYLQRSMHTLTTTILFLCIGGGGSIKVNFRYMLYEVENPALKIDVLNYIYLSHDLT